MVNNWLDIIQHYLLPPTCILCGHSGMAGYDICEVCYGHLPRNSPCCVQCGLYLPDVSSGPLLCGRCLGNPPAYDQVYAPFMYQGSIRHLLAGLKFAAHYKHARLLGMLLAVHLQSRPKPALLLPMPLHNKRYRQRGFNQSIEIAKTVAKRLHIPLVLNLCIRQRDTPEQKNLSAKQRRQNIKNAFVVRRPLQGETVAILDDIMTTGSTVQELALALKQAGAGRVEVWVCARA